MNAVLLRFTLLAPAIGTLAFNAINLLLTRPLAMNESPALAIIDHIGLAAVGGIFKGTLGLFLGFPLGLLPAFLASAIYWFTLRSHYEARLSVGVRVVVGSLAGLSAATAYGGLFFSRDASGQWLLDLTICWAGAGLLSGAICGAVVGDASFRVASSDLA